jgi:hypothetical protein
MYLGVYFSRDRARSPRWYPPGPVERPETAPINNNPSLATWHSAERISNDVRWKGEGCGGWCEGKCETTLSPCYICTCGLVSASLTAITNVLCKHTHGAASRERKRKRERLVLP